MSEQKKPKFKVGDEVVITSMYPDGSDSEFFTDGEFKIGKGYVVSNVCVETYKLSWCPSSIRVSLEDTTFDVCESMLTLASDYYSSKEKETMQNSEAISLDNTKINVQAYAKKYGITLEQANKEVKDFLGREGYTPYKESDITNGNSVFIYEDGDFTCDETGGSYFIGHNHKEIFFERNITLTIKQEPDTISFDGKKYIKEEFLKAIQNLNVVD